MVYDKTLINHTPEAAIRKKHNLFSCRIASLEIKQF